MYALSKYSFERTLSEFLPYIESSMDPSCEFLFELGLLSEGTLYFYPYDGLDDGTALIRFVNFHPDTPLRAGYAYISYIDCRVTFFFMSSGLRCAIKPFGNEYLLM